MEPVASLDLNVTPYALSIGDLSLQLRERTSSIHKEVELKLRFPESILDLNSYRICLSRFYSFYGPIEARFARFYDWSSIGIILQERNQSEKLAQDLMALGVSFDQIEDAPLLSLPKLPSFAHALGGLYVLEGSTLGAQYILPRLRLALREQIVGADSFFNGHGANSACSWKEFRAALDLYGEANPDQIECVLAGARSTFTTVGDWMQS